MPSSSLDKMILGWEIFILMLFLSLEKFDMNAVAFMPNHGRIAGVISLPELISCHFREKNNILRISGIRTKISRGMFKFAQGQDLTNRVKFKKL